MAARPLSEVSVGDVVGPVTVPVSRETLVAYANASGDQNPIHQDEAFARSVGLPDVIAHGMWTMGASATVVTDWAGDAGRVVEFGTRFTKPVVVPGRRQRAGRAGRGQGGRRRDRAGDRRRHHHVRGREGARPLHRGRAARLMRELHDEPIAAHTTMRVGGPAARMVVVETPDELVDAVREVDDADEPLLVLGGGSNLVVADAGFAGTVVKVATRGVVVDSRGPVRRRQRHRRGGGGLGRLRRARRRGGLVGRRGAVRHPGLDRRHPDAERRRLRPGGRADRRPGAGVGPARGAGAHDDLARLPLHLPALGVQGHRPLRRHRRDVPARSRARCRSRCATPTWPRSSASRWGRGCRWREAREAVLAAAPATGHGARRRRPRHVELRVVLHQPDPVGVGLRRAGGAGGRAAGRRAPAPPRFADADGKVKTSAAWLIERAGFAKGFGLPGPAALSTKHTLARDQPGRRDGIRRLLALAREVRDGVSRRVRRDAGQRAGAGGPRALRSRRPSGSAARPGRPRGRPSRDVRMLHQVSSPAPTKRLVRLVGTLAPTKWQVRVGARGCTTQAVGSCGGSGLHHPSSWFVWVPGVAPAKQLVRCGCPGLHQPGSWFDRSPAVVRPRPGFALAV